MNVKPMIELFEPALSVLAAKIQPLLEIEESKYYTGANIHAASSAYWVQFAASNSVDSGDPEESFVQSLDSLGVSVPGILSRATKLESNLIGPLAKVAAALVEILAKGIIKGSEVLPEIIVSKDNGRAFAITTNDETEVRHVMALVLRLFNEASPSAAEALRSFMDDLAESANQPSFGVILNAAERLGVPWSWNAGIGYHQLGHGRRQMRVEATITGKLPAIGVHIARRKPITNEILRSQALPVPVSYLTNNPDEALAAAQKIRYPVVVKPMIGHKGEGVTVGVGSEDALLVAYKKALNISRSVIVEQFIAGEDVRLLVAGRKLVAAAKRIPPQVIGDGKSEIAQLIEIENRRRSKRPALALPIEVDRDLIHTLEGQGYSLNTVLPANAMAKLRTVANWSQGGTAIDLTDHVHPDNADMAVRAALAVGIDVAGVDFLTPDISRPYYEVGGAICEINFRPGLRVHMAADPDGKRDLGSPIIKHLFADDGRIEIIYTLDAKDGAFSNALAAQFTESGMVTRVSCAYESPDLWQKYIELALQDPECDVLVINAPASAVVNQGAGVEYCRAVVRFGVEDAVQRSASNILEKMCRASDVLAVGLKEKADAAAARIADALGLTKKSKEPVLPPAEITTSRNWIEIAQHWGLPTKKLAYWNSRPLLQFGYGASRSAYHGGRTGATSHIATRIADDKRRTNALLRAYSLPHPTQVVVDSIPAAIHAAIRLGYPLIVKPTGSSEGRGVTGNILNNEDLAVAVVQALHHSSKVIVEPYLKGKDHRFLVIGGKAAHVTRHEIAQVTGDGRSTVEQLVAKSNEDPRRGPEVEQPYTLLYLEEDAERTLARQGLSVKSVPADGQTVQLSSICHLSTGATAVDVTDLAHPDNIAAAERIARLIGLDICGVDFLHPDVTKSYKEVGGAILEVNQRPSFDMHDASTNSVNRVRSFVLRELSKSWNSSQIPLVRCIFDDGFPTEGAAQLVLQKLYERLGLTGGVAIPARGLAMVGFATIKTKEAEAIPICDAILSDPRVEAALFFTGSEPVSAIPESAKSIDFRSSEHSHSLESITEAIVGEFTNGVRTRLAH